MLFVAKKESVSLELSKCLLLLCVLFVACRAAAQVDQGAISGVIQDKTGAVIQNAQVTLTSIDTGLALQAKSDSAGIYNFSPVKIGDYSISASYPGFKTITQLHVHLDVQQKLNIPLVMVPGAVTDSITVTTAPPSLQTEEGSVGQVISTDTINDTPLNGRNWVYIAQFTPGVNSVFGDSQGAGTGDFTANGQGAEQNNFILDGVDNNTNIVDYLNGASYNVRPPPDALAEFKIQTSSYSAEFGHSAGAVVNASIKSGTNQLHGDLWEYFRNTHLDAQNWNAPTNPPYHENQFGGTLGAPVLKNKLFYFGDAELNRISIGATALLSVPTPLMRTGNFTELLNPSLTTSPNPIPLFEPNSGGNTDKTGQSTVNQLVCNGQVNVLCQNQIDPIAQKIANLFPLPNTNGGKIYNNYVAILTNTSNTWQWDQRLDWNISAKDQAYARYSYLHVFATFGFEMGPILDGTTSQAAGDNHSTLAQNFMLSETHIFNPQLTNEFRFGYNWADVDLTAPAVDVQGIAQLGLGGVPYSPRLPQNYGLPYLSITGNTLAGAAAVQNAGQNVYQILDNVTKIAGKHSLKAGVAFQNIRYGYYYSSSGRGAYYWTGLYTSSPAATITTGSGTADFLVDQMSQAAETQAPFVADEQEYSSYYVQDDWRVKRALTLNLGLRYDYLQPAINEYGSQANLVPSSLGLGTGSAVYQIVNQHNVSLGTTFPQLLAANNITLQIATNPRLLTGQRTNFAPRLGFAYQVHPKYVINGGFGIFYGGIQGQGGDNMGIAFPFNVSATIPAPSCSVGNCPSTGITLENGFSAQIAAGLQNFVSSPAQDTTLPPDKTPYTMDYNLAVQRQFSDSLVATVAYVGNVSRHAQAVTFPNTAPVLLAPGANTNPDKPFPGLGQVTEDTYTGVGTYNALQAKVEKQYSHGLTFLATYTRAHAMDDIYTNGLETEVTFRQYALIPAIDEFTNSTLDVRDNFTFIGNYKLPFGHGQAYVNNSKVGDLVAGGWSTTVTFIGETGTPFTVTPDISTAAGASSTVANAVSNPFASGGTPNSTNPSITCATSTRNKTHWFNPCAFDNPLPGNLITAPVTTAAAALPYLGGKTNQVYGPGFSRVNMSLFKSFSTWREQSLQFRADAFNLLNHPSLGLPSASDTSSGGLITAPKTIQANTPDARFFQLSLKYIY